MDLRHPSKQAMELWPPGIVWPHDHITDRFEALFPRGGNLYRVGYRITLRPFPNAHSRLKIYRY